jgi:hypothetical protein
LSRSSDWSPSIVSANTPPPRPPHVIVSLCTALLAVHLGDGSCVDG